MSHFLKVSFRAFLFSTKPTAAFLLCTDLTLFLVSQTNRGTEFRRSHHIVRKTTLYDMGVDPTCKYAAVGCQDRCIRWMCWHSYAFVKKVSIGKWIMKQVSFRSDCRIFNISSGEQKKLYKGSLSEDGSLLRVTFFSTMHTPQAIPFLYTVHSSYNRTLCIWSCRYRSILQVNMWLPAAPIKTLALLTSTLESVLPPCLDTQVTERTPTPYIHILYVM